MGSCPAFAIPCGNWLSERTGLDQSQLHQGSARRMNRRIWRPARNQGLLDAALNRPNQLFAYDDPDIFDLVTAYISGIIRNHPFFDGNKRTAFVAGVVFLERNGKYLKAPEAETTQAVLDLAAKKITEQEFAIWLKKYSKGMTKKQERKKPS